MKKAPYQLQQQERQRPVKMTFMERALFQLRATVNLRAEAAFAYPREVLRILEESMSRPDAPRCLVLQEGISSLTAKQVYKRTMPLKGKADIELRW